METIDEDAMSFRVAVDATTLWTEHGVRTVECFELSCCGTGRGEGPQKPFSEWVLYTNRGWPASASECTESTMSKDQRIS